MLNPKLLGEAFPINKVEVFFDSEDHSNFLGFQWEKVSQGRIPIGLDTSDTDFNTIGKTGGEKEHSHLENVFAYGGKLAVSNTDIAPNSPKKEIYTVNGTTGFTFISETHNADVYSTEKTSSMPPYIVMAFWKRIA